MAAFGYPRNKVLTIGSFSITIRHCIKEIYEYYNVSQMLSRKIQIQQDACTGVHSACRREENGHNLDIGVLRRLRLRQGQMQGFLGLKVGGGGGLICKYGI